MLISLLFVTTLLGVGHCEVVYTTKFFTLSIEPNLFNWTLEIGEEYKYHASLLRAPDLPDWIQYLYSRRHRTGFLYGVPPPDYGDIELEVVGMNRRSYETRRRVLHLNVMEKSNPATHHVHLKIDNLNVEDLFDSYRMTRLLDIFRHKLWTESFTDLYVTFLASAVTQGARLPLRPNESEGVVMRLGSSSPFSFKLSELQEEVKPLWKIHACPRDFKRTTVERWFRDEGFVLDWCSFKLVTELPEDSSPSDSQPKDLVGEMRVLDKARSLLPQRSYAAEFAVTILVPMLLMVLLVVMLSIILCFQHEGMDEESETFFRSLFVPCEDYARSKRKECESEEQITQYVAVQCATSTLRSLSRPRDTTPDPATLTAANDDVTRPTPPPYVATLRSAKGEF